MTAERSSGKGGGVGRPVVHFEIIGQVPAGLRRYYGGRSGTPGTLVVGRFTGPEGNLIGVARTQ
jgi:hypothetical protein